MDVMSQPISVIQVGLVGACGKIGVELSKSLGQCLDIDLVLAIDTGKNGCLLTEMAGPDAPAIFVESDLEAALQKKTIDVLVDFTHPDAAKKNALIALSHQVAPVIGTSGITSADQEEIRAAAEQYQTPAMIVPNFALGAVLMMKFAEIAAKWFLDAEIIEMHHDQKADAPSGTAYHTAEKIATARQKQPQRREELLKIPCVRGGLVQSVPIHSVRLKGLMAHQRVIFGASGETLTLSHDSIDRTTYNEGVKLAIREIRKQRGLVIGLDTLLFQDQK